MKAKSIINALWIILRYDLPLWFVAFITDWLPENRITLKLRGTLFGKCFGSCGKNLTCARNVQIRSPNKLRVGDNVYFASGVWLNAMGGLTIEDEVIMAPYVVISTGNHQFKDGSVRFGGTVMEPIIIGKGSWLAAHVVVRAGVTIGKGVIVAANAFVSKDVEDNTIVGGVPAKLITERQDNEPIDVKFSRFKE